MNQAIRAVLFTSVLCAFGSHADDLSYTAVSLSVVVEDWEDSDENSRGLGLDLSVEVGDLFYAWARASRLVLDVEAPGAFSDIQNHARSAGVGIHRGFADKLSMYGEVGAMRHKVEYKLLPVDLSVPGWVDVENAIRESDSVNGWIASGGLRAILTERIELFGSLTHREAENDGVSRLSAGIEVGLYRDFGLRASVFAQEDSSGYGIGIVWRH